MWDSSPGSGACVYTASRPEATRNVPCGRFVASDTGCGSPGRDRRKGHYVSCTPPQAFSPVKAAGATLPCWWLCVHLGTWLSSFESHSPPGGEVSEPGTLELCLCFHPSENTPLYLPESHPSAWLAPLFSQKCNQTPLFFFFVFLPKSCSNSAVSVHSISVPDYFQRCRTPTVYLCKPFSKFILYNLVHLPSPRRKSPLLSNILHHFLSLSLSGFLVSQ